MEGLAQQRLAWLAMAGLCLAFGLPLGVYLRTLAPTIYNLDSPDLTAAAYTLGIAHAPGYPFYTLLGWLFSHAVPLSDVGYRLNLMSALLGAGTVYLVYHLARQLTGQVLPSLAAALMLAFSYHFWADSLTAEVYTLDTLLLAGLLFLLLRWSRSRDGRLLFAASLLLGLSLANRASTALFIPAVLAYLWLYQRPARRAIWLVVPAGIALGLLPYLYIPLAYAAGPSYVWSDFYGEASRNLTSLGGFWWLVSAAPFHTLVGHFGLSEWLPALGDYGGWLTRGFLGVGVALGLVGIWQQARTARRELILLAGIFLPQVLFYTSYAAIDREFMFLPSYLVWALWAAVGIVVVGRMLGMAARDVKLPARVWAAALLLPLVALVMNYSLVDLSSDRRTREDATQFLALAEPGAMIVGRWIDVAPMEYLQVVEGQRQDVTLIHRGTLDRAGLLDLARRNVGERPFYLVGPPGALAGEFDLVPVATGYRVFPREVKPPGAT
jgi:4-amino-4-deoxy-L-arabinose transferase-like glycosyltransferase